MFKMILLVLSIFLAGCEFLPFTEKSTVYHPPMPRQISVYNVDWKVIVIDDVPYVALTYEDSLEFRIFLEDVHRYIIESNAVLCFYNKSDDSRCTIIKDK